MRPRLHRGTFACREVAMRRSTFPELEAEIGRQIFEAAPIGKALVSKDGRFLHVNPAFCRFLGYTKRELLGMTIRQVTHPDDWRDSAQAIREIHRKGAKNMPHLEKRYLHKDGKIVWGHVYARAVLDAQGNPRFTIAQVIDITERKRVKAEIRRDAEILDQIHDSVIATDLDGYITNWNKGAERMFGYTAKEAHGRHVALIYPKGQHRFLQNELIKGLKTRGERRAEVWARRKSGEPICVDLSLSLLRDERGSVCGMIGYSKDITDRKRAEEERDRILKLSSDLICIAGMDGYFKYVNPAWRKTLGYTEKELLTRPFLDFIHPEDHRKNDREVAKLSSGQMTVGFENRYVHKNGSVRTFNWTATPVPEENVMYCIGRDITARKQAEQALQEAHDELEQRVKDRTSKLRALAVQLGEAEEKERRRKAQILHDDLLQILVGARMALTALRKGTTQSSKPPPWASPMCLSRTGQPIPGQTFYSDP